jgi:hypothetical protein
MPVYAQPKSRDTIKRVKGRKVRAETAVKQRVRFLCVERDGDCRVQGLEALGACSGESEWAHLEDKKRARTRGMLPEERHATAGSAMFCTTHHQAYDAGEFAVEYLSEKGADGPMAYRTSKGMLAYETSLPIPVVLRG